jgi:hypothetical protein
VARLRPRALRVAIVVTVLSWPAPDGIAGQTLGSGTGTGGRDVPEWMVRWSPVALTGDILRDLPGQALAVPSVLISPPPKTGVFWTAANPAGLPWDVSDRYVEFRLGTRKDDGEYRRPLDPGGDARLSASALGWRPLTASGAVIGRVQLDRLRQDAGARAADVLPYSSNPLVMLDTLGDSRSGLVARLDGAGGWRLGRLGIGLGLGYDGREVRTETSPVPIRYRVSAAGFTGGVTYELLRGLVQLGAYGRWEQLRQDAVVSAYRADSRIYVLRGYFEPSVIDVSSTNSTYRRMAVRDARAFGGTAAGGVGVVTWNAYLQRSHAREGQSTAFEAEPPTDDWDAEGWTAGFAVQARPADRPVVVTVSGRFATLEGRVTRMDLDAPHFSVDRRAWQLEAEITLLPHRGWSGALRIGTGRDRWLARDSLAAVASDLHAWKPGVAVEVARVLPRGFALALGVAYARHMPWGTIPAPATLSEGYQEWIAPELSLYGTSAHAVMESATIRWHAAADLEVWVRGMLGRLFPRAGAWSLPLTPLGSRQRRAVTMGITIRAPESVK